MNKYEVIIRGNDVYHNYVYIDAKSFDEACVEAKRSLEMFQRLVIEKLEITQISKITL